VLLITHAVREAAYLADRVLVLSPRIEAGFDVPLEHPRKRTSP
jgi:ABC-type nitrate/sulfonate/bicarbonate transport system ATPase subunit